MQNLYNSRKNKARCPHNGPHFFTKMREMYYGKLRKVYTSKIRSP